MLTDDGTKLRERLLLLEPSAFPEGRRVLLEHLEHLAKNLGSDTGKWNERLEKFRNLLAPTSEGGDAAPALADDAASPVAPPASPQPAVARADDDASPAPEDARADDDAPPAPPASAPPPAPAAPAAPPAFFFAPAPPPVAPLSPLEDLVVYLGLYGIDGDDVRKVVDAADCVRDIELATADELEAELGARLAGRLRGRKRARIAAS